MWFNPFMAGVLRSPFHGLLSHNTILITVCGKKTGRRLMTPVNYLRRGDELLTVSFRSRTWWRNLRGGAPVELLLAGTRRDAFALRGRDRLGGRPRAGRTRLSLALLGAPDGD
jgi:hypothetical protein